MKKYIRIFANSILLGVGCLLLGTVGCEQTFQPFKENNEFHFSFYGYLDVTADTQWVRISPAREQLSVPTELPDMRVTLEDLESGNSVTMHDSLFKRTSSYSYWNFWTTMDIKPEHTYRLLAERSGGGTSSVTVTTPEDFPKPKIGYGFSGCTATLSISGVDRLADAESVWRYSQGQMYRFSYRSRAYGGISGIYTIGLDAGSESDRIKIPRGSAEVTKRYIFVAAGGPEWVAGIDSLDDPTYTLPDRLSNVENGLGYVVGIVSKTIPYERCY